MELLEIIAAIGVFTLVLAALAAAVLFVRHLWHEWRTPPFDASNVTRQMRLKSRTPRPLIVGQWERQIKGPGPDEDDRIVVTDD